MQLSSDLRTEVVIASIIAANLVNWLLHGVLTVQIYLYYLAFPNDRTWLKVVVYTTYILETIQAIGFGIVLILIIVSGNPYPRTFAFGSFWTTHEYKWATEALLTRLIGGLVPLIAQCIYAHRIRIIMQWTVIPSLIIAIAILQLFAATLTLMIVAYPSMIALAIWTGLDVINDLIIAFVMVRSLSKEKPLSDYMRSKVTRLVRLITATGSLTVTANILSLVLIFVDAYMINSFIGTVGVIFIPKLYANSILVMLNNRMTIKNSREATPLNMISTNALSTLVIADHRVGPSHSVIPRDEISVSTL